MSSLHLYVSLSPLYRHRHHWFSSLDVGLHTRYINKLSSRVYVHICLGGSFASIRLKYSHVSIKEIFYSMPHRLIFHTPNDVELSTKDDIKQVKYRPDSTHHLLSNLDLRVHI